MNTVDLPQEILDRVIARRGRLHIFERIDPVRTALLAIDLQHAYLADGAPGFVASGREIVPVVTRVAQALRAAGGTVVWLRNTLGPDILRSWGTYGYFREGQTRERMLKALEKGSPGHSLWHELDIRSDDLCVDKRRYSAFIPGSCDLEKRLRDRNIDTLLIGGLLANVCCESTARDAMMLDFKVIMVADAVAAHSEDELRFTLANILFVFGDVMTSDHVINLLLSAKSRPSPSSSACPPL